MGIDSLQASRYGFPGSGRLPEQLGYTHWLQFIKLVYSVGWCEAGGGVGPTLNTSQVSPPGLDPGLPGGAVLSCCQVSLV